MKKYSAKPNKPLPQDVIKAFSELAVAQRDKPEEAMIRFTSYFRGGQPSSLLEHVGDLTHRMTEGADRPTTHFYLAPRNRDS